MNNEAVFHQAIERDLPVTAHVRLKNGEERLRVGPVAKVNRSHVTIYDIHKGYRTTPLNLVISAQITEPKTNIFGAVWKALRSLMDD